MFKKIILFIYFCILGGSAHAESAKWWEKIVKEYEGSVVQVETSTHIGLNLDASAELAPDNSGAATGFVVDADLGIVVSNYHVITGSPNIQTKIRFKNGEEASAKVLYVDPWVDFGFLKYDPKSIKSKPKTVILGSQNDLHVGEEILLVGNSSNVGISSKQGYINYLFKSKVATDVQRPMHCVHATLGRAGGASGSPVWNKSGKVIGLHSLGKDFEAFFVRIDYIKDALVQIQKGMQPKRGDLFFNMYVLSETEAKKFYFYPENLIKQGIHENNGPHSIIKIDSILAGSKSSELAMSGDIIVSIQGKNNLKPIEIGNSLYTFDKIVNDNVGGKIKLTVFRSTLQNTITFELPVSDANLSIPHEYSQIGSAIFQNVTPTVAIYFGIPAQGVYIPFIGDTSSSTWNYGQKCRFTNDADNRSRCIWIQSINGKAIKNLEDFNKEIKKNLNRPNLLISVVDLADFSNSPITKYVDLKMEEDISLKKKTFDLKTLEWTAEEIKP